MGKHCKYCGRPAIVDLKYANLSLCEEHFIEFYQNRIKKVLTKYNVKGPILVAVSAGKDSMALLHALKEISKNYDIEPYALHIDLGIFDFSLASRKVVLEYTKKLRVPLILVDLKEEIGFTIPELVEAINKPACAICGVVKRWLMNKIAYESGIDWLATGHNLDDLSTYLAKAMFTQDLYTLLRAQFEVSPGDPELKLVSRIRPQLYLTEYENMLYVKLNNIPYLQIQCPYGKFAPVHKYKAIWNEIKKVNPVAQINFVRTLKKLLGKMHLEKPKLRLCKKCGYPTQNQDGICAFCRIVDRAKTYYSQT